MHNTKDLLEQALKKKKASEWCRELNVTPSSLSKAKRQGHVSPRFAAFFAIELGADPGYWAAIATAEAEPPGPLKDRLERSLKCQERTHYGHTKDDDEGPNNRLFKSVFCCLDTTRASDKPAAWICHKPMQWHQAEDLKRPNSRLRDAHQAKEWDVDPIGRPATWQHECRL